MVKTGVGEHPDSCSNAQTLLKN